MGADVAADASADMADDVSLTQPVTRPGQRSDPTRSTVKPDPGQRSDPTRSTVRPDPVNSQTRPGQWSTGSTVKPDPVNTPKPCCTRCHTRRTFWWRVRARERVFLGNFGTCRFVSKLSTMWYIDFACLKLLKI